MHVGRDALRSEPYVRTTMEVADEAVAELGLPDVGSDWRLFSQRPQSQEIRDGWYDGQASPVLHVPSVIMSDAVYGAEVSTYLLNGRHPKITQVVRVVATEPLNVNWRLR